MTEDDRYKELRGQIDLEVLNEIYRLDNLKTEIPKEAFEATRKIHNIWCCCEGAKEKCCISNGVIARILKIIIDAIKYDDALAKITSLTNTIQQSTIRIANLEQELQTVRELREYDCKNKEEARRAVKELNAKLDSLNNKKR
jgi:hypothetical protein